jgi:polyhydroxybutyrate depolymerase
MSVRRPVTAAPGAIHTGVRATRSGAATTNTYEIIAGGLLRTYQVIRPNHPAAARIPALVVLHGVTATTDFEERRDGLLPVAAAGQAVLVYPVGLGLSWNARDCCQPATAHQVDDVGFIAGVIHQLGADPVIDAARVTLIGFSNGGRMVYQVDCARPGLVTSIVSILAAPATPCASTTPVSLLAIANADDPQVPYAPGSGAALGRTAVTDEVNQWAQRDGCASSSRSTRGQLTDLVWQGCRQGSRVELGTYASGGHLWPVGDSTTPSAERLIWSFAVAGPGRNGRMPR